MLVNKIQQNVDQRRNERKEASDKERQDRVGYDRDRYSDREKDRYEGRRRYDDERQLL